MHLESNDKKCYLVANNSLVASPAVMENIKDRI